VNEWQNSYNQCKSLIVLLLNNIEKIDKHKFLKSTPQSQGSFINSHNTKPIIKESELKENWNKNDEKQYTNYKKHLLKSFTGVNTWSKCLNIYRKWGVI